MSGEGRINDTKTIPLEFGTPALEKPTVESIIVAATKDIDTPAPSIDVESMYDQAASIMRAITTASEAEFVKVTALFSQDPLGTLQMLISDGADAVTDNATALAVSVQSNGLFIEGAETFDNLLSRIAATDMYANAVFYGQGVSAAGRMAWSDPQAALDIAMAQGKGLTGEAAARFDTLLASLRGDTGDLASNFRKDPGWVDAATGLEEAIKQSSDS